METELLQSSWSPYTELLPVLENIFTNERPNVAFLKRILRAAKPHFLNVFKNPPKNAKSREQIMKVLVDGKPIQKFEMLALPKEMAEEVLILSDMYDLDELMSLELLNTARYQNPKYPELCRGLVAVLLYYNAHRMLVSSLRLLIEGSTGRTWVPRVDPACAQHLGQFVDQLMNDGLFINIIILLECKDLSKEIELLQKNKAIGGPKHHQLVVSLFTEIRSMLAECIFYYSIQFGLSKQQLIILLQYLQKIKPDVESQGVVSKVPLFMVTSFLYAIDLDCMNSTQEISGDAKEQFLSSAHAELIANDWEWPELKSIAIFGLAVAFAKLRSSQHVFNNKNLFKIDETLISNAMDSKVFRFLNQNVAPSEFLHYVEFMIKKFHQLVTEFIVIMPYTVKEIRNKSDEIAHTILVYYQEGLEPPNSEENHFEQLLMSMTSLYAKDPLNLNLNLDYWPPSREQLKTIKMSSFLTAQKFQASLYRFICQTGDMLPHMLFVPYLNMLSSLAISETGAENVFNHFHSNATNSNLTWDHFFKTFLRYYTNLRQENIPPTDTVYKRSHQKGITALEIQGLQAVLQLVRNVAKHSIKSKISFVEHSDWETLQVLLGLVSCPVRISLKADLILTLATLVKPPPPTTAINFWQTLEASQMIVTVPTISNYQSRGIMTELDDIETRNEEYPLTIALLTLLSTLTEQPVPILLGSSNRKPGFDPYLNFVLHNIFLKCLSRGYKKQNEKWEVSGLCLELAFKFLNQYEPQQTDFVGNSVMLPDNTTIIVNPPPGFHIMTYLCTNSDFLKTILNIMHTSCQMFDLYSSFSGKEELEKTSLIVLRILEQALSLQQRFLNASISCGSPLIYTGLHKTLVSINVTTNEPDYIIDLSKFITYTHLPEHSYHAICILINITSYPIPQSHMVSYFTSNPQLTIAIRHGFVQCLEEEESTKFLEESNDKSTVKKCKESILKLLLQCLNSAPPNLAHYLLGFNLDNVPKTCFENAGVNGNPRNCLHSIIDILDDALKSRKIGGLGKNHSKLLELCYQLIYILVSSNRTSKPVLVYLKSRSDFVLRHASALPFYSEGPNKKVSCSDLIQMNWLLRIIAVEIKMHVHQNLLMTLTKLILLFIGNADKRNNVTGSELLQSQSSNNLFDHSTLTRDNDQEDGKEDGKKLLSLLGIVDLEFETTFEDMPELKYLESKLINQLLSECEISGKVPLIDVKKLHSVLMNELKTIDSSSPVKANLLQEIQEFLAYAVNINDKRLQVSCMIKYFDSWHQLTAVIFSMANLPSMEFQQRFTFVIDLLVSLQIKVIRYPQISDLSTLITNSQLLLLINLKNTIDKHLELCIVNPDLNLGSFVTGQSSVYSSMLQNILKCIQQSGTQKLRASLYSSLIALINLLATNSRTLTNKNSKQKSNSLSVNQQILDSESIKFIKSLNFDQYLSERILEVICVDLTSGHDICKVLSYTLCELLIDINPKLISYISNQGYLKCIISSLLESDSELKDLISTKNKTLKPIYVYENKMSLLNKIATYTTGADALLNHQAIACLSSVKAIDAHPSFETSFKRSLKEFMPDEGDRYMMICAPAMCLCQTIISTLGTQNMTAILQVVYYLISHRDIVTIALTNSAPLCEQWYLKELNQLTSLLVNVTNDDINSEINSSGDKDIAGLFHHYSVLMRKTLIRFSVNLSIIRGIRKKCSEESSPNDGDTNVTLYLRITLNLLNYVSNLMDGGWASGGQKFKRRILDVSVYADPFSFTSNDDFNHANDLSMGTIVTTMIQTVEHYFMQFNNKTRGENKKSPIHLFGESNNEVDLEKSKDIEGDQSQRILCKQIVEVCLYILWAHTDFYFMHSPVQNVHHPKGLNRSGSPNQEEEDGVTPNELKELRQGLVKVFNDAFLEKLFALNEDKSEDTFVQVMVHRIKKLLQFVSS
ncbi:Armadillo-like helical,Nucleoporin Nup186/Nup192/Nup205 [Cinara cedri]|uniref:Armadillo-like helical,Nucleoporin Nup186/Nup192/Nup205 n=1 Tax=Cinara cedri TaxID=506608 RepID=A0A5E4N7N0_9HEMI|nr:Armadillo-like helical,Nucleoporin Nup186/Nup192/Nup205 [Cinara cedri]